MHSMDLWLIWLLNLFSCLNNCILSQCIIFDHLSQDCIFSVSVPKLVGEIGKMAIGGICPWPGPRIKQCLLQPSSTRSSFQARFCNRARCEHAFSSGQSLVRSDYSSRAHLSASQTPGNAPNLPPSAPARGAVGPGECIQTHFAPGGSRGSGAT